MSSTSSRWSRRAAIWLVALFRRARRAGLGDRGGRDVPSFRSRRDRNYTVTERCPDGSTSTTLVSAIGGHEEESEDGVSIDSDFVTVRLQNSFDC